MSKPLSESITVTAKCSQNPGMEYVGADTPTGMVIFRKNFDAGDADTGNFIAIVHALRLLKRNKVEMQAIYSSSKQAVSWVKRGKCKPLRKSKKREELQEAVKEAEDWLAKNEFNSEILNWNKKQWGDIHTYLESNKKK